MAIFNDEIKIPDIDYIMIVNKEYKIVYNSRYDSNLGQSETMIKKYNMQNFFSLYPSVHKKDSSIVCAMTTGKTIVRRFQKFKDNTGRIFCTNNVTVPIYKKGKIIGAVELIKDLTNVGHLSDEKEETIIPEKEKHNIISGFDEIITQSLSMVECIEKAELLAKRDNHILIYGETGTGKELFVKAIINKDIRSKSVIQNCAAIPENLLESLLFGTSKGAYTGAENRTGLFEEANGGILFLDEISMMPYHVQGKLLRIVQDGTFRPVGSNKEKKVDVKIIAAMNTDPIVAIKEKMLRKDLFYRLSGGLLSIPPLRKRSGDIRYLANYFLGKYNSSYNKDIEGFTDALLEKMEGYEWEGNVRELEHTIESMVITKSSGLLSCNELPSYIGSKLMNEDVSESEVDTESVPPNSLGLKSAIRKDLEENGYNLKDALMHAEHSIINETLNITGGNKTQAGKILGIPRQTITYKLDKFNKLDK